MRIEVEQLRGGRRGERTPRVGRHPAAGPGPDEEVGTGVAVEVPDRHPHPTAAGRVAGEEVGEPRLHVVGEVRATKGGHAGAAAGAAAGDEFRLAVAVEVARGDVHAVAQGVLEGEEVGERLAGERPARERGAVEHGDAGAAVEAGRDDEVADAVAGEVADGRAGTAAEVRVVDAEEVRDLGEVPAAEHPHPGAAAIAWGDDQVGHAVAGQVAGRDEHAAGEVRLERGECEQDRAGDAVVNDDAAGGAGAGADDQVGDAVAGYVGGRRADAAGEVPAEGGEGLRDRAVWVK